jgi:hypothetical protein
MGAVLVMAIVQCSPTYSIEELNDHTEAANYYFATMQNFLSGFIQTLIIMLLFHEKKKLLFAYFSIIYILFFGGTLKRLFGMKFMITEPLYTLKLVSLSITGFMVSFSIIFKIIEVMVQENMNLA